MYPTKVCGLGIVSDGSFEMHDYSAFKLLTGFCKAALNV